jgi:hypothetical protein
MPETAAANPAGTDSTDLTTMDGTGVELEIDPGALEQLNRGAAGRLPAGVRLVFRAALVAAGEPGAEHGITVELAGAGRFGALPPDAARRYRTVLGELRRRGRGGACAGYLQRTREGGLEARLLLHEPYECLRRIEADVLDAAARRSA